MPNTTTFIEIKKPTQAGKTAESNGNGKSWFKGMLESRREAKAMGAAIKRLCAGEDGAPQEVLALYGPLDEEGKAKAVRELAGEFVFQTNELNLSGNGAEAGARIVGVIVQLAQDDSPAAFNARAGIALERMGARLSLILEDETENLVYHKHPELLLACAKAVWALKRDEAMLSNSLRDPPLADWAMGLALKNGCLGVLEECALVRRYMPALLENDKGRVAVRNALLGAENGDKKRILDSISGVKGPGAMMLATELANERQTAQLAMDVADCAKALGKDDRFSLAAIIFGNGFHEVRSALAVLASSEKGHEHVTRAVMSGKEAGALLEGLASLGEEANSGLLLKWLADEKTRQHAFEVAAMLPCTSLELQKVVHSYAEGAGTEQEKDAAIKALTSMLEKEAVAKATVLQVAVRAFFNGMSAEIVDDPRKNDAAGQSYADAKDAQIRIEAVISLQYSLLGDEPAGDGDLAAMKIAAMGASLENMLQSWALPAIQKEPWLEAIELDFGGVAGAVKLDAHAKISFAKGETGSK